MTAVKFLGALLIGTGSFIGLYEAAPAARESNDAYALRAFGRAVAISGEYAFVGEPNVSIGGRGRGGGGGRGGGAAAAAGVVHVYRYNSGASLRRPPAICAEPEKPI
jgi:hypothetical protein